MTPEERDELRAAAEAATPEPWSFGENPGWRGGVMAVFGGEGKPLGTCRRLADAYYIAGASPDTILGLLDALDAVEAERDEARRDMGSWAARAGAAEGAQEMSDQLADRLMVAVARARALAEAHAATYHSFGHTDVERRFLELVRALDGAS